ncbi:ATP-binding protein [uncultured Thiohalocapsa sp.]|uniref:ATP-binding protein n=1 Tax=uncultured Thiohalocapsa sp. TaxID=768990 RepID=UPI0025DEA0BE|nr:ATP-binding protein [uncultured Thiohalocapsa sp.]
MGSPITRIPHLDEVDASLRRYPVVALLGARQVGKTTLARQVIAGGGDDTTHFDLEDPADLSRLADPMLALKPLRGLVVLDEVQRKPDLFPILRVLADRPDTPARFLVLGSASPELLRQSSESLAGRIHYHELPGFNLAEVGADESPGALGRLWLRGGFPRAYLAASDADSAEWRQDFIRTFLERDLPALGIRIPAPTLRRFWTMLAHYHAQVWNGSELARAFGVAHTTVRGYLDLLDAALVLRQLQPWHENLGKRQVKSPKIYIADSGLLHSLLGIETTEGLESHPKVGASWEGFVIEQILSRLRLRWDQCWFWATHAGAELDLLVITEHGRRGFEIKRTTAPKITPSMRHAIADLGLDRLDVIHAGEHSFPLAERIQALSMRRLLTDIGPLEP